MNFIEGDEDVQGLINAKVEKKKATGKKNPA
jgi:hypothetical protein